MCRGFLSPRAAGLQVVLRSVLKAQIPNHLEWYFLRKAPCGRQTLYCTAQSLRQPSIAAGGLRGLRVQAERRLTINAQLIHLNPEGLTVCLNLGSRSEHVQEIFGSIDLAIESHTHFAVESCCQAVARAI